MDYLRHTLRQIAAIFRPPFNGLGLLVVIYFAWAHIVFPNNDVMRGNFPDPDDYMALDQVLDWIKGQGWYDNIQHRLDPPADGSIGGTPIHFSRLGFFPLALGILLLKLLGLPWRGAATVTAFIDPLLLLGCCLYALRRLTAHLTSMRWSGASAYITVFMIGLLFEFMPGHVDHHGLVILLMMVVVEATLQMFESPDDYLAGAVAGFVMAIDMMIALEAMPWLLLVSTALGLWAMRHGAKHARNAATYAISLVVGSALCLIFTRPPSQWLTFDILTYSSVYVVLAAAIALPFFGVLLARPAIARWTVGLLLALVCGEAFLMRFPDLLTGPYGALDPQLVPILLDEAQEAHPILDTSHGWQHFLYYLSPSLIALPASLWFTRRTEGTMREKWLLITALLAAGISLTTFYQYRFLGMALAFGVAPLTTLLEYGWHWIAVNQTGRARVLSELCLLLALGPLFTVLIPATFDGRSFNTGVLLYPVESGHDPCDMSILEHVLRDPKGLGAESHTILTEMTLGPEILFRTDHRVLAAPYHMNLQGNLDTHRFFTTPYTDEAEHIVRRRKVDLVLSCNPALGIHVDQTAKPEAMIQRLFQGPLPSWLEPVELPGSIKNFVLFRVKPESAKSSHAKKNPAQ